MVRNYPATRNTSTSPNEPPYSRRVGVTHTWRVYGFWFVVVGAVFFAVYPLCNWISSQRAAVHRLYLPTELAIPQIQEFIWVYLSMYALFFVPPFFLNAHELRNLGRSLVSATLLSGLIFLVFPTHLGFPRYLPNDPTYQTIFSALFSLDQPHNMIPSLHVVYSALIVLALTTSSSRRGWRSVWWLWLILLCSSTLFVHQHHVLDIISGLLVAVFFHQWMRMGEKI